MRRIVFRRRLMRSARVLQTLARGFMISMTALRRLSAVSLIQRAVRCWLGKLHAAIEKLRVALWCQSRYRGRKWRSEHPEVLDELARRRLERRVVDGCSIIADVWKTKLVQRRFELMRRSARVLQHFAQSLIRRRRFLRFRDGLRLLQRYVSFVFNRVPTQYALYAHFLCATHVAIVTLTMVTSPCRWFGILIYMNNSALTS